MDGRTFEHMTSAFRHHRELLAEAALIHTAAEAVKQAREEAARRRAAPAASLAPAGTCPRPGEPVAQFGDVSPMNVTLPGRRPVWRRAAGSVGNSLVQVGRRLERMGAGRGGARDR